MRTVLKVALAVSLAIPALAMETTPRHMDTTPANPEDPLKGKSPRSRGTRHMHCAAFASLAGDLLPDSTDRAFRHRRIGFRLIVEQGPLPEDDAFNRRFHPSGWTKRDWAVAYAGIVWGIALSNAKSWVEFTETMEKRKPESVAVNSYALFKCDAALKAAHE